MNIFLQKEPFFIAGPCSIESKEYLEEIFMAFQDMPITMIRGGVWKPRSKPGFFEGKGVEALEWIQSMSRKYQQTFCIEVANKEQVEKAIQYGIKAVWIGARTSVNPFMVQEIADALKGTSMAVMVKNPINPDTELWCGAIERIQAAGIESIAAIHRGFSSYDNSSEYRNKPIWAIPIEIKRRYKQLPIICDVSHICGKKNLLLPTAQKALDLDFDGLMVEVHPQPEKALSDAQQQITPTEFKHFIKQLIIRKSSCDSVQNEIESIRSILDTMDAEIIELIAKRMNLVKELGKPKVLNNIVIFQQERWRQIVKTRTNWGENNALDNNFILKLFELIHDTSIKMQIDLSKSIQDENAGLNSNPL
ncbi:MAG: DAHP synthetase I/KDSA [Bacteroidetes bacterium OLB11]|nr:MAG: DAHP synthetase I/KDSA [Bacteroidetes bacterium OLB11]